MSEHHSTEYEITGQFTADDRESGWESKTVELVGNVLTVEFEPTNDGLLSIERSLNGGSFLKVHQLHGKSTSDIIDESPAAKKEYRLVCQSVRSVAKYRAFTAMPAEPEAPVEPEVK